MIYIEAFIEYIKLYFHKGEKQPLLKPWAVDINPRYTSTLLSVLRGSDSGDKDSKKVTQMLRYLITNDVGKKSSYMSNKIHSNKFIISTIVKEYDDNKHWVEHVLSAAHVIMNNHPEPYIRAYWSITYHIVSIKIKNINKAIADRKALEELQNNIISKYHEIYMFRGI